MLKNTQITYCQDVTRPNVFNTVTFESAVNEIKSCKYEFEINKIRSIDDKDVKHNRKKRLPYFSFGGTFKDSIANDNLLKHSGLFQFDLDKLDDVDKAKEDLKQIAGMALLFVSVSGNGLKGFIHCTKVKSDAEYKILYGHFEKEIADYGYIIDPACKDIRRACFVSYDPNLYVNYGAACHDVDLTVKPKKQYEAKQFDDKTDLRELLQYISPDCDYSTWVNVGFAIYHETNGSGFDFWDAWSTGGNKYDSTQENHKKWLTFGKSSNPKKMGYLVQEAKHGGYVKKRPEMPKKKAIINDVAHKVDLLSHVETNSLMYKYASYVSRKTHIPINSAFLMGLGVFSSMACRAYHVSYEHGSGVLPIGLYTLSEQPPGGGKSWCLRMFQEPFHDVYTNVYSAEAKPKLFINDTTPEALEKTLTLSHGFFSLVSSEQSLLDTLLGGCYQTEGRKQNNGMVLNGFDGGWSSSTRITREGYEGYVSGAFAVFAQEGTIATVLNSSNGTGLSDRFLMLSEPHNLGKRDHFKKPVHENELMQEYNDKCFFARSIISDPMPLKNTTKLTISSEGYRLLTQLKQDIEPYLADGEKYSNSALRGAASKINMQAMKLAANLHLINGSGTDISDATIKTAISVAMELLSSMVHIANDKEIIGMKANISAILSYMEKRNRNYFNPRIIKNELKNIKVFKESSLGGYKASSNTLDHMVANSMLSLCDLGYSVI